MIRSNKILFIPYLISRLTSVLLSAMIWLFIKGALYSTIATLVAVTFWVRAAVLIHVALRLRKYRPPAPLVSLSNRPRRKSALKPRPATPFSGQRRGGILVLLLAGPLDNTFCEIQRRNMTTGCPTGSDEFIRRVDLLLSHNPVPPG